VTATLACLPYEIAVEVIATLRDQAASNRVAAQGKSANLSAHYEAEAARIETTADAMFNAMTYRSAAA